MKVLVISNIITNDDLGNYTNSCTDLNFDYFSESNNPLKIISYAIDKNPSLIILDDDFTNPNSTQILKSIKNINKEIATIFLTSDSSLELGREISQMGIQFYAIKPIKNSELVDSIKSIINLKKKTTY